MPTDWNAVAAGVTEACPSPTIRAETAKILDRVELLGGPMRAADVEFKRVYQSLQWNEPDRVLQVVHALLPRVQGEDPKLVIRADAWGYVIGMLDEWIIQSRIMYLVLGILEASLRTRINARLTDAYGLDWPSAPDVAPSGLHELTTRGQRDRQLGRVHEIVEAAQALPAGTINGDGLLADLQAVLQPPAAVQRGTGPEFLRDLTFHGLRMFLEKKKLWKGKANLQDILSGRDGRGPKVQYDQMKSVIGPLNDARNDVSHYRPLQYLTFEIPLFAAAKLAAWLGEDLQHIYSSIDTRNTTELSVVLGSLPEYVAWSTRPGADLCLDNGCRTREPFDWLLRRAPIERVELAAAEVDRACLYHRVSRRVAFHRPGATGAAGGVSAAPPAAGEQR